MQNDSARTVALHHMGSGTIESPHGVTESLEVYFIPDKA